MAETMEKNVYRKDRNNMTINEILQAAGLDEATIQKITDAMKANKVYTASEENLDIRYGKLKTQHEGTTRQLEEANGLIEQLKKSTKGQEDAQQKITAYEQQVQQLQADLLQTKIDAAARYGLLAAGGEDVDYLLFVLKEDAKAENKPLELDEAEKIKGWDDRLKNLQTKKPKMFKAEGGDDSGYQVLEPNKLKKGDDGQLAVTKERFKGMSYEERVALKQQNETLYKQLAKS